MNVVKENSGSGNVEAIVNQSVDGIIVTDETGALVYANPAAETLFGKSSEQFLGSEFGFPVTPGESTEITIFRKSLGHRIVELRATEINWHGRAGMLISLRDITERKNMEREIRSREEEKSYLMENIADAVITLDENNHIITANKAAGRIFGYDSSALSGMHIGRLLPEGGSACLETWLIGNEAGANGVTDVPAEQQFHACHSDGTDIILEVSASWIDINNKRGYILAARDITSRLEAERKLHIVTTAIDQSLVAKLIVTTERVVEYVNNKFLELTGFDSSDVMGDTLDSVFGEMGLETDMQARLARVIEEGGSYETQSYLNRDNEKFWVEQYISPIRDSDNNITHFLVSLEDVTQKINLARQLEVQSAHDELTGLLNRRGMEQCIDSLLDEGGERTDKYYLYYIDIDQFSIINEACGNAAGDDFLRDLAGRLDANHAIRDRVARLEADTFLLILEAGDAEEAEQKAYLMQDIIHGMRFVSGDKIFNPTATISCTCLTQWQKYRNTAVLIQRCINGADIAKEYGGDQVYYIVEDDQRLAKAQEDTLGASLVHKALDQNMFCLFNQPIRLIHGSSQEHFYEILIRMKDGDEFIPPARFLGAAEKYRLGAKIDQWVINHIFSWLADNPGHLENLGHCGINISAESLATPSLINYIAEMIGYYQFDASKICIEVTETAAVKNLELANGHLRRLKDMGVRIALDDFGTGMSSFNYLKQLDIDYLKIDGAFVKNIRNDPIDFAMVNAIKDVGKVMGIKTIAEFVEDEDTLSILSLIGIDYAQGYGIGKPAFFC